MPLLHAPLVPEVDTPAAEPFNWTTVSIPESPLAAKWRTLEQGIEADMKAVAGCREHPGNCASPEARHFIAIVDQAMASEGIARIGIINRAINLAIRPQSDWVLHGEEDHWSSPLATLAAGAGDCEDYAIAKYTALRAAGIPTADLRLLIAYDSRAREQHALVAVKLDGHWRLLDNRHLALMEDTSANWYRPMYAIDSDGPRRFAYANPAPAILVAVQPSRSDKAASAPPTTRDGATNTI
jgi:predicted transglutaminase-like cysteine proteinase